MNSNLLIIASGIIMCLIFQHILVIFSRQTSILKRNDFSLKEMKREDKKKNFVLPTWLHGIEVQKLCTYTWRYTTSGTKVKRFHAQCACKVGGPK